MEETKKRTRNVRTKEERIAALDEKIAYHTKCITTLKKKKEDLLKPSSKNTYMKPSSKNTYKELMKAIKASGKTPDEILKMIKG